MGGDFNAKHTHWGSRIITTKGRELYKALQSTGCSTLSTGAPTYWPTDPQKIPDLIDFFITRNFSSEYMRIESGLDLNSDHSPIYLTIHKSVITKEPQFTLTNKYTDWDYFRKILSDDKDNPEINSNEALDDEVLNLSNSIQRAAWRSTPATRTISAGHKYTREIKEMVREKRKARRRWQQSRSPPDKITLNKITKELSKKIKAFKNHSHSDYLKGLTNEHSTDYSLWNARKDFHNQLYNIHQ